MAALKNHFTWEWNALPPPWNPDRVAHAHGTYWRLVEPGPNARRKICCIFLRKQIHSSRDLARIQGFNKGFSEPFHDLPVIRPFPLQLGLNYHICFPRLGCFLVKLWRCLICLCDPPPAPPQFNLLYPSLTPLCLFPLPSHPWDTQALSTKFSGKAWHVHLTTSNWISYTKKHSLWNESLYPLPILGGGMGRNMCRLTRVQVCIYLCASGRPSPVPFKFKECILSMLERQKGVGQWLSTLTTC